MSRMAEYLEQVSPQKASRVGKGGKSLIEWAQEHVVLKGKKLSFEGHAYLREIYELTHPDKVFMKAAQVCISTYTLAEATWLCDTQACKAMFFLSTDSDAEDFANDRFNPMIGESPYLNGMVRTTRRKRDNVGLKHIGGGALYIRGLETRRNVKSVDADLVVLDEMDEANQKNVQFALDRLLHSSLHWIRRLSQPSVPDYGIALEFADTDQRYWHLRCSACNHWQCLELELDAGDGRDVPIPKNFLRIPEGLRSHFPDKQEYYRGCIKCGGILDMENGQWIAKHPDRRRMGYHVSQLYTTIEPPDEEAPPDRIMKALLGARTTEKKANVVISIIGNPFGGDRQPLTEDVLTAAEGDHGFLWRSPHPCYMGVDMGNLMHTAILDAPTPGVLRLIWLQVCRNPEEHHALMERYNIRMAVMDSQPEARITNQFCVKHPGRAYRQRFTGPSWRITEDELGDDVVQEIQVDRTLSLDDTCAGIVGAGEEESRVDTRIFLPFSGRLDIAAMTDYLECRRHLTMLIKDLITDARGRKRWDYKHDVPNHYGMAINSARIAYKLLLTTGGRSESLYEVYTSGVRYRTADALRDF